MIRWIYIEIRRSKIVTKECKVDDFRKIGSLLRREGGIGEGESLQEIEKFSGNIGTVAGSEWMISSED